MASEGRRSPLPEGAEVVGASGDDSRVWQSELDGDGQPVSYVNGLNPERKLEEGACVCLYTPRGQLLVVRPAGRYWDLAPIAVGKTSYDADGNQRLDFHPPESIFTVLRKGRYVGFRSLAAEGKTLQASGGGEDMPHRINNHNFGDWESWEPTEEGLMNAKFKKRALGFEIREVRAVAVEDLRGAQMSHLRAVSQINAKLQSAEYRISESERRAREVLKSSERQQALHEKELEHVRARLEDALCAKQKRDVETLRTSAAYDEVEARLQNLEAEKNQYEMDAMNATQRYQAIQREMQLIRERHDAEVHRLELAHNSEMSALSKEKELELKRAIQGHEDQIRKLKDDVFSKGKKKDHRIDELEVQIGGAVKEKDRKIKQLLEECTRLHAALRSIKGQVENAHLAKVSIEAGSGVLSPPITSPVPRSSPISFHQRSRTSSRSPSQRTGRLSADSVLHLAHNPALASLGLVPARRRSKSQRAASRSGARAPEPQDGIVKDQSPTSTGSDVNPPISDNDHSEEILSQPSLGDGIPLVTSEQVNPQQWASRRRLYQHPSVSLSRKDSTQSDGDESDSFQSIEEEENLESFEKGVRRAGSWHSGNVSLRSFPVE